MKNFQLTKENEVILWEGKKKTSVSVLDALLNPTVPFAVGIMVVDMIIFLSILISVGPKSASGYLNGMAILHFLPLFIYVIGMITAVLISLSVHYVITNENVYLIYGIFKKRIEYADVDDILYVGQHRSLFDRMCHTADISIYANQSLKKRKDCCLSDKEIVFLNVKDYEKVIVALNMLSSREETENRESIEAAVKEVLK